MEGKVVYLKRVKRTSLVIQWLRIPLPMQGNRFDPWSAKIPCAKEQLSLCTTTAEPTYHNYSCTRALEPVLHNERGHCSGREARALK